jgi:hypothetical protein
MPLSFARAAGRESWPADIALREFQTRRDVGWRQQGELGRVRVGFYAAARQLTRGLPAGADWRLRAPRDQKFRSPHRSQPRRFAARGSGKRETAVHARGNHSSACPCVRVESRSRQATSGPEKPSAVAAAEGGRDLALKGETPPGERTPTARSRWRHRGQGRGPREGLLGEGRRPGSFETTALHGAMAKAVSVVGQKASPSALSAAWR